MEKVLKVVKSIVISLIAILVVVIAIGGIYSQKEGIWKNVLPEYNLGMEISGFRELRYSLDETEETKMVYVDSDGNYKGDVPEDATDTSAADTSNEAEIEEKYKKETRTVKANPDEIKNIETYNKAKEIIQKRLDAVEQNEYNIRVDSITGELVVEIPDDDDVELMKSLISTKGTLTVADNDTGIILIDDTNIEQTTILTHEQLNEETGAYEYQLYMQCTFDEVGKELFRQVSKEYIATVSADGTVTQKCVVVKFDDQQMCVPLYFDQERTDGQLQIPLGEATDDYTELAVAAESGTRVAELIDGEKMPLVYELTSDNFVKSEVTDDCKTVAIILFAILVAIISIYMIIKYKLAGLKQSIIAIGYIGLLVFVIRYIQIAITFNSIIAFVSVILINYVFSLKLLDKLESGSNKKVALINSMKELYLAIVPVCIIAVIFTFMSGVVINSIGMMLFWGLLVQAITSLVVLL